MTGAILALFATSACQSKGSADTSDAQTPGEAIEETISTEEPVLVLGAGEDLPQTDKIMVLDFNATWCGPCKKFAPTFEAVAKANVGKALFISIDIDSCSEIANKFGVQSIPHVAFVQPDGTVNSYVGIDQLEEFDALAEGYLH